MSNMEMSASDFDGLFSDEVLSDVVNGKTIDDESLATKLSKEYEEGLIKHKQKSTNEDFDWEIPEDDRPFYDKDFDGEDDETDDLSPSDEPSEDSDISPMDYFSSLEEDAEIAPGFTKAQIRDMIRGQEESNAKYEYLNQAVDGWERDTQTIRDILGHNLTETNRTIIAIQNKMDHPSTLRTERGELYSELQRQQSRLQQITSDWKKVEETNKANELRANEQRWFYTNDIMNKDLGRDWNKDNITVKYALMSGLDVPTLERSMSPALAKVLVKAMKFDNAEKKRADSIKDIVNKSPRSTQSAKVASNHSEDIGSRRKLEVLKAANNGDSKATSAMFDMLED